MGTTKMPLGFLAAAMNAAKNEMINKYAGTCCVSATGQYTVFLHDGQCLVSQGNLRDKVESDFCVEFDLRYVEGKAVIICQRLFN